MPPQKCAVCEASCGNEENEGQCTTCKSIYYCSATCQNLDEPLHQLLCQKMAEFLSSTPRPESKTEGDEIKSYKLAILFPANSSDLKFIWVEMSLTKIINEGVLEECFSDIRPALMEYLQSVHTYRMDVGGGRKCELKYGSMVHGGRLNEAFKMLTSGYGTDRVHNILTRKYYCRGNMILVATEMERHPTKVEVFQDVTLADFRRSFNALTCDFNIYHEKFENKFVIRDDTKWAKGVQVNCSGEGPTGVADKYQEVRLKLEQPYTEAALIAEINYGIHSGHQACRNKVATSISEQMGMDLAFEELGCPTFRQHNLGICHGNRHISFLKIDADPRSEAWGTDMPNKSSEILGSYRSIEDAIKGVSEDAANVMHSTIFVRKDRKDLTRFQVEALAAFSQEVLWRAMSDIEEEFSDDVDDEEEEKNGKRFRVIDQYLRSSKFEDFFEEYKQNKINEGDLSWALTAPPPRKYSVSVQPELINSEEDEGHQAKRAKLTGRAC